jgi:hypothetical protein
MRLFWGREVQEHSALRWYGVFLCLAHLVTWYRWQWDGAFAVQVLEDGLPLCWPFFQQCDAYRDFLVTLSPVLLSAFAAASLIGAVIFPYRPVIGMILLAFSTALKAAVFLGDYRLMGNYHYMFWWASAAFLFLPRKGLQITGLLVSFYFFAGLLKLNQEWMGGHALLVEPVISGWLLTAGLAYVIILELLVVPLLLTGNARLRFWIWVQLAAFHLFSWHIVGYLYPLIMLCLTAILLFPAVRYRAGDWRYAAPVVALFAVFQAVPWLIPGDSSISGEGRFFSLNMLDARMTCSNTLEIGEGGRTIVVQDSLYDLETRIRCDPYVHFSLARRSCSEGGERSVRLLLAGKRSSDESFRTLAYLPDACSGGHSYSIWRRNTWILPSAPEAPGGADPDHFRRKGDILERAAKDGSPEWQKEFWSARFLGLEKYYAGESGLVAVTGNERVLGLDPGSGKVAWLAPYGGMIASPSRSDGQRLYIHSMLPSSRHRVTAIWMKDGSLSWQLELPIAIEELDNIEDGDVFVRTISGSVYRAGERGLMFEEEGL